MRKFGRHMRAAPASIAWLIASALVVFPVAVVVGFYIYNTAPHRWLGGTDGYYVFGSFFLVPLTILAILFHLLLRRRIFGSKLDAAAIIVIAVMATVDGLMIPGALVISMVNHIAAGSRTVDVSSCDAKPFFQSLERCNGRTYGLFRTVSDAHIAIGTPRWTLAHLRAVGGTQPNGESECQLPEVHHPAQCSRFGLPAEMSCFFCRKSGRGEKSSLLAFSPMSGKLIRIWSDPWDLSQPQSRPDQLTDYFDTAPYWAPQAAPRASLTRAAPPARPPQAR
jgi:hypothetical protein